MKKTRRSQPPKIAIAFIVLGALSVLAFFLLMFLFPKSYRAEAFLEFPQAPPDALRTTYDLRAEHNKMVVFERTAVSDRYRLVVFHEESERATELANQLAEQLVAQHADLEPPPHLWRPADDDTVVTGLPPELMRALSFCGSLVLIAGLIFFFMRRDTA